MLHELNEDGNCNETETSALGPDVWCVHVHTQSKLMTTIVILKGIVSTNKQLVVYSVCAEC